MSLINGMKNGIPISIAYIPYAMGLGLLAKNVGVSTHIVFLMSLIIYAGSSELIMLSLYPTISSPYDLVIPAVVVNIRYLLINLPILKFQKNENKTLKLLSAMLLTDEGVAYLMSKKMYGVKDSLGLGLVSYLTFCVSTLIGAVLGDIIDSKYTIALNFVLYAIFLSLLFEIVLSDFKALYIIILTIIIKLTLEYIGLPKTVVILVSIILGALIPTVIILRKDKKR